MLFKIVYLLVRRLLSLVVLVFRGDRTRDAELLVLRPENAVLRRTPARVRYEPADRLWPGSTGRSEIRTLYIFDPKRNAVLLVAGDKAGKREAWYRTAIPFAEER